jgi:hypothetical protein
MIKKFSLKKKIILLSIIFYFLVIFFFINNRPISSANININININDLSYELTVINKIPVSKIFYDEIKVDKNKIDKKNFNQLYFIYTFRNGRANTYAPQKLTYFKEDKEFYHFKIDNIFNTSPKICKEKNKYVFDNKVCKRAKHELTKFIYLKKKNKIFNQKLIKQLSKQCEQKKIYGDLADIKYIFCKKSKNTTEVKFEIKYHSKIEIFKEYLSFDKPLFSETFGVTSNGQQKTNGKYFTSKKNFLIKKNNFENHFDISNLKGFIFDEKRISIILNDYRLDQFHLVKKGELINVSFKKNLEYKKNLFHIKSFNNNNNSYLLTKHHSINNFNSAHMFADHADNSTDETLKALYFGKSNFNFNTDQKIEGLGFVGNSIPVTQSFFYNFDENEYKKKLKDPLRKDLSYAYLKKDSTYKIADEIRKYGSEIAIHTMSYFIDTDENLLEGLKFIKNEKIKTWIDHYLNTQTENLSNSAYKRSINKKKLSEYYYDHGLRNFWVGASENNNNDNKDNNMFYVNGKEAFQQIVWRNDLYGDNFRIFPSVYISEKKKVKYYSKRNLKKFTENLGYSILHTYLTGVGKYKNKFYYNYDNEKKLFLISPEFNQILKNLKTYQDEGLIWNTTVAEFIDHQIYLENIIIKKLEHNEFKLINSNKEKKNISVIINKKINRKKPQQMNSLENIITSSKNLNIIKIKNLSKNSIMINFEIENGDHFLKIN